MSEDELQNAFKNSKLFKDTKEINKENLDDDEPKENYYKPRKIKGTFGGNYVEYESNGDTDKASSIKNYLNKIEPYLIDIINKHKEGWKIQLTAEITFSSVGDEGFKKSYPIYMHSKNLKVYDGF